MGRGGLRGSQAGRSQRGVPTQDDLQLRAVQLAPVGQGHDALLVPVQSRRGHVLSRKKTHAQRVTFLAREPIRLSFREGEEGNRNGSANGLITILFLSQRSLSKASNSCSSI